MASSTRLGGIALGLPEPPLPTAEAARARHARRALEQAAAHGVALLEALGLPRLVTPDFVPVDMDEVGDAIDTVIAALDEVDTSAEDLEDVGDDEGTLGWHETVSQLRLGPPSDDGEHTLGAPERHPFVFTMTAAHFRAADGREPRRYRRDESQAVWAQGAHQDGEGEAEPGYDLAEGDDERCASGDVDGEPSLGSVDHLDQTAWADGGEGGGSDRELDPLDDIKSGGPGPGPHVSKADLFALTQRAKAIRRRICPMTVKPGGNLVLVDATVLNALLPHLSWSRP